jgi:hypothetical protein
LSVSNCANPKDPTKKYFTVSEYRETFFPERMSTRGLLQRKIEEMNLAEKGSELEKR